MLFNLPQPLQYFFQIVFIHFQLMSKEQRNYTKATVCAILFSGEKVNMSVIGKMLAQFQRTKSSVSRMYRHTYFFTQDVAWVSV